MNRSSPNNQHRHNRNDHWETERRRMVVAMMTERQIQHAIFNALLKNGRVTSDDIYDAGVRIPDEFQKNNVGQIFNSFKKAGLIYNLDEINRSRRPDAHGSKSLIWYSDVPQAVLRWLESHPLYEVENPQER